MTTVRTSLNKANPASLPMDFMALQVGEALNLLQKTIRTAVVNNKLVLPELAKAVAITSCFAVGTTSGYKTPLAVGSSSTPSTTQCRINAQGDIEFASADAITLATVVYLAAEGEVFQEDVDVISNVATPLASRSIGILLSATSLVGTLTGAITPVQRGATPSTGQAAIQAATDKGVLFATADAVTRATLRYLAVPGEGTTTYKKISDALNVDQAIV